MRSRSALVALFLLLTVPCPLMADETTGYPRPPRTAGIYVVAHRGAHRHIPENTLAAYRRAIELNCDFVEIDLRTTRDGHLVSIHNSTIDAYVVDGSTGKVRDLTLARLRQLDVGSRSGPQWAGQQIPTLDEILTLCRDRIGIYLDLKDASVEQTAAAIRRHQMEQQVVWCVSPDVVPRIRRHCPKCLPMPDPRPDQPLDQMLARLKPRIVAPVWAEFSAELAAACHRAGAIVIVDEQSSTVANWQQALNLGADGIQTDDPQALIRFLKQSAAPSNPR